MNDNNNNDKINHDSKIDNSNIKNKRKKPAILNK